ncbi:MAG TPA: hypothetical protein VGV37_27485 [Aliidongia sp.]|uniref:hypothetical protein n=1 Tax=Aliidongia sp. TaxID=1914230 RepID=UPI002DDD7D32|nr:hypothetical protein [Aliidongia sp.]HEV2678301.1 hypothetical protein [Aliidongia sp.]
MSDTASLASPGAHATGDALLLGLAAHYARAVNANLDFDDEQGEWAGAAQSWLDQQAERCSHRIDPLIEAICSVPAESPVGALIQLQALSRFVGIGSDDLAMEHHWDRMREQAIASIQQVLLQLVDPTIAAAAKAMQCMGPGPGPFVDDVPTYVETMKRSFAERDIDLVRKPRSRRAKGGAQ